MASAQLNSPPELLQVVFDAAPLSIAVLRPLTEPDGLDLDFEIVLLNSFALERFGLSRGDVAGKRCGDVFPAARASGLLDKLSAVALSGERASFELTYPDQHGQSWLHIAAVVKDGLVVVTIEDVTARRRAEQELRQAEQALQESKELLQSVFDASLAAVSVFKAVPGDQGKPVDLEWVLANQVALARAGGELIGKRASQVYPAASWLRRYLTVLKTSVPADLEDALMLGGELHWFHVLAQKYKDNGLIVTSVDITDRKRAERDLLGAEQELARSATDKYVTLFRFIDEGFLLGNVLFDDRDRPVDVFYLEANPTATRLLGEDYTGKRLTTISPQPEAYWLETLGRVARTGKGEHLERYAPLIQKWISFFVFKVGEPSSRRIAVLFQDITERKATEEALRLSKQRLQRVLETDAVGVIFFDQDGNVVNANDVFLRMTGYNREQIERRELNWRTLTPPEWLPTSEEQMSLFAQTGRVGPYEKEYFFADGSRRWMLFAGRDVGDGTIAEFCIDITERKRAEAALRQSEEKFRTLFNSIDEGFAIARMIYDDQGRPVDYLIVEANPQYEQITGLPNPVGKTTLQLYPQTEPRWFTMYDRVLKTGEAERFEQHAVELNQWFEVYAARIGDAGSHEFVMVFNNITERKQAAAALQESDQRKTFLLQLSDALRPLSDPAQVQAAVTRTAMAYFGSDRCYYCEIEDGNAIIRQDAARAGLPSVAGIYPLNSFPIFKAVVDAGRPLLVEDAYTADVLDEQLRQSCIDLQVISFVDVPVIKDGAAVGILCITHCTQRAWTKLEVDLAVETAERTWAAVEQARAETALRDSQAVIRGFYDSAPFMMGIGEIDGDRTIAVSANRMTAEFLQRTVDEVPGNASLELGVTGEVQALWLEHLRQSQQQGAPVRFEYEHTQANARHWLSVTVAVDGASASGRPLYSFIAEDVTERKQAAARQAYLLHLSDALRPLADPLEIQAAAARILGEQLGVARVMYGEVADDGENLVVERNYVAGDAPVLTGRFRMSDFGPALVAALHAGRTLVVPEIATAPELSAEERAAYAALGIAALAGVPLMKDGRFVANLNVHDSKPHTWTAHEITLIEDTADRTWSAVARARAEAALRASEERFRLLVDGARDYAMFLLDPNGRISYWSAGAERIFGWTEAEALGQSGAMIFTHQDRAFHEPQRELETARTQGRTEDRRWQVRKDGGRLFLDSVLVRLDDETGTLRGYVKVGRDATLQHRAEEALLRAHDELELRVLQRTAELEQASLARQELLQRLVTAQEDERRRIARELHDTLGQFVSALNLRLSLLQQAAAAAPAVVAEIAELRPVISQIDYELDRLTMELRPPALDDFGLPEAARNYAEAWTQTTHIPVDVLTSGFDADRLPSEIESTAYRIFQEALTNIVKHAQASAVSVVLERRRNTLQLIIEDNGIGFDLEAAEHSAGSRPHLGLLGMRERATLAGGSLQIETAPGAGTTLFVQIPLPAPGSQPRPAPPQPPPQWEDEP